MYLITYNLAESSVRQALGGLGQRAGNHPCLLEVETLEEAVAYVAEHLSDDCFGVSIQPIERKLAVEEVFA